MSLCLLFIFWGIVFFALFSKQEKQSQRRVSGDYDKKFIERDLLWNHCILAALVSGLTVAVFLLLYEILQGDLEKSYQHLTFVLAITAIVFTYYNITNAEMLKLEEKLANINKNSELL